MKVQRTIEVDGDHLVPKGRVGIEEVSKDVPAGDVGQKVDRADIPFERGDRLGNLIALGDVDTIARGRPPQATAVASAPPASMSRMPTEQPSSASRMAVARPMPLAPPVSRTRRSFSPRIVSSPSAFAGSSDSGPGSIDNARNSVRNIERRSVMWLEQNPCATPGETRRNQVGPVGWLPRRRSRCRAAISCANWARPGIPAWLRTS